MAEYIEREAVVQYLLKCADGYSYIETPTVQTIQAVNAIPTADVVPVRHGKNVSERGFVCSVCRFGDFDGFHGYKPHYCPNCGAKMDGDGDV